MRTTINLDDELLAKAQRYTGITEKSELVREALRALVQREASRRMALLGGAIQVQRRAPSSLGAMIIVDTNVWIDHLRDADPLLIGIMQNLLQRVHPFVVGELAQGNVAGGLDIVTELEEMPQAEIAEHVEVLSLIRTHKLHGLGIGYVDAHLLASAKLMPGSRIWTRDKRLASVCDRFGVAFQPLH